MSNRGLLFLSAVLMLSACGGEAHRTGVVTIVSASRQLVGTLGPRIGYEVQLELEVANGTEAPAYVYDAERRVSFDEGTQRLTVSMQDVAWVETGSSADCHLFPPSYRVLRPLEVARVNVRLPRAFTQARFPTSVIPGSPEGLTPRELPVEHARAVTVELAWSDRPFEPSRRGLCSRDLTLEMGSLQRGTATALIE
jgi:hypothetical protein